MPRLVHSRIAYVFIRFPDESSAFISKFQDVAAMDYTTHQLPNHQPMFPVSLEKSISLANPPLKPTFLFFAKKMTVKQKKPFNVQILRFPVQKYQATPEFFMVQKKINHDHHGSEPIC